MFCIIFNPPTKPFSDNPDLALLKTLQDSLMLNKQNISSEGAKQKGKLLFWVKWILIIATIGFVLIYFSIWLLKRVRYYLTKKREKYLASEKYFFDVLIKTIKNGDMVEINNALYAWIDRLDKRLKIHSLGDLADKSKIDGLKQVLQKFHFALFSSSNHSETKPNNFHQVLISPIKAARKSLLKPTKSSNHDGCLVLFNN